MSGSNGEIEWNIPHFDEEMAAFVNQLDELDTLDEQRLAAAILWIATTDRCTARVRITPSAVTGA
jgi:hypothetical protein